MKKFLLSALVLGAVSVASADLIFYVETANTPGSDGSDLSLTFTLDFFGTPATLSTIYRGQGGFPEVHAFEIAPSTGVMGFFQSYTFTRECPNGPVSMTEPWAGGFYSGYNDIPTPSETIIGAGDMMFECGGDEVLATELPTEFALRGAYPNPFNPTTTIEFDLAANELVSLNVYNINGQLVNTLVSGAMEQGRHQVTFDASNLSSGVYLYTLEAGSFTDTQKMVLVK